MKKILILSSVLLGFGVTALLAEDATVTLPALTPVPAPAETAPAAANVQQGSAPAAGKKHHKPHHKKKASEATPAAAPKS